MNTGVHQFEDKLLDFAYGELQPREAEAVDAHVRGCPRCTEALSHITQVRAAMQTLPVEPAPTEGLESLLAFAEQHAKHQAQHQAQHSLLPGWWRRLIVPVSSALALVTVGVVAMRAGERHAPDAVAEAFKHDEPAMQKMVVAPLVASAPNAENEIDAAKLEHKHRAVADVKSKEAGKGLSRRENFSNSGVGSSSRAPAEVDQKQEESGYGLVPGALKKDKTDQPVALGTAGGYASAQPTQSADFEAAYQAPLQEAAVAQKPRAPGAEPVAPVASSLALPKTAVSSRVKMSASKSRDEIAAGDASGQVVRSEVASVFEAQLGLARAASSRGDRRAEIKECLAVLNGGAQGTVRAEVLRRLCEAYEALGEAQRAQGYCDALFAEFGQSSPSRVRQSADTFRQGPAQKAVTPKKVEQLQ